MLKDGVINAYWVQVNNNLQAAANLNEEGFPGYRNPDNFIVVSEAYPTVTAQAADLDPADRDVGGEGGRLRQRRAAHAVLAPARRRPGRVALGPVAARGVLQALHDRRGLAGGDPGRQPRLQGQDALRRALRQRSGRPYIPLDQTSLGVRERRVEALRLLHAEGAVRGVRRASAAATRTTSRRSTPITRSAACAGRWSTARRRAGASARARTRTSSRRAAASSSTATTARAKIFALPYEPPAESPDEEYDLWLSRAACSSTGTPAP